MADYASNPLRYRGTAHAKGIRQLTNRAPVEVVATEIRPLLCIGELPQID